MSAEHLSAFLAAVNADAGLREKLKGVTEPEAIVEIAKESGFSISSESLQKTDLSDEELASVTGAGVPLVPFWDFKEIIGYLGAVGTGW